MEGVVQETEDFILPRRGRGRLSATAEAEYREKLAIFCKKIKEIDSHDWISKSAPAAGAMY